MHRASATFTIKDLRYEFPRIEFPEYQREPNVWSLDQKQRLIDSILRRFDIAAIYLYERDDGDWECIDGRQRLNAIMSFLDSNPTDEHNGFTVRIHNEVADEGMDGLEHLSGRTFDQLDDQDAVLGYEVLTVILSGVREP